MKEIELNIRETCILDNGDVIECQLTTHPNPCRDYYFRYENCEHAVCLSERREYLGLDNSPNEEELSVIFKKV